MSYYLLKLYLTDTSLHDLYATAISARANHELPDAGFDLFTPNSTTIKGRTTYKVDHKVKCSMVWVDDYENEMPVAFYLYPRSSTATKTPLRLANSVGIIDAGYRGSLIAAFDNWSEDLHTITASQRLVQVCPPDLSNYPLYVALVETEDALGATTRGEGGFGSTGI